MPDATAAAPVSPTMPPASLAVEQVLAVPRSAVAHLLGHGLTRTGMADLLGVAASAGRFLDRPTAEVDPSWKQLIPYIVVSQGGRWLRYERTAKQGEARLHRKLSLGFGGHINPIDAAPGTDILFAALVRELNEEIRLPRIAGLDLVGIINDDSNLVGQVHLGLVYHLRALSPDYTVGEPDRIIAGWATPAEVQAEADRLESWSRFVFDSYASTAAV